MTGKDLVWEVFHETVPELKKRMEYLEATLRDIKECGCVCISVENMIGNALPKIDYKARRKKMLRASPDSDILYDENQKGD